MTKVFCCDQFREAQLECWIQYRNSGKVWEYHKKVDIVPGWHIINDEFDEPESREFPMKFCPWCGSKLEPPT